MRQIRHRLAYQHARWIATQPIKDRFWFRTCRKIRRVFRWIRIYVRAIFDQVAKWFQERPRLAFVLRMATYAVALLFSAVVIVGALWLALVGPSEILQWNPDRRPLQGAEEIAAVALTRVAIITTFATFFLWCILPGSDRNVLLRLNSNQQGMRRFAFLRKPAQGQAVSVHYLLPVVAVFATVAVSSLCGIFARLSHPFAAVVIGIVFFITTAWMVHRIGLRMMRKRSNLIWRMHMSAHEFMAFGFAFVGLFSLVLLATPSVVVLSQYLQWLGPVGYAMANLQSAAAGNYLSLIPVLVLSMLSAVIGWWSAKDAGTWANRRKLISSRRLVNRAEVKEVVNRPTEAADFHQQIQSGLNQTIESRQLQSRGCFAIPFWLQRRHCWYWIIGGCMLVMVLVFGGLKIFLDQYEQTQVVGGDRGSPIDRLTKMFWMPFVFVLLCTEAMALFDHMIAVPVRFLERPLSSCQYLWRVHREGILRLPFQLVLSLPFSVLLFFVYTRNSPLTEWGGMLAGSVAFLLAMRTLYASCYIMHSIRSISNRLIAEGSQILFSVFALATFAWFTGSATVIGSEISLANYLYVALGINLFMLLVFSVYAISRRQKEQAAADSRID